MQAATPSPTEAPDPRLVSSFAELLVSGALPGETDGFGPEQSEAAATFLVTAALRRNGSPRIAIESLPADGGLRRMRLAIVNDDMPFLVDSVSAAVVAHGLDIHRLLHPVVAVRRDADGVLTAILPGDAVGERRESLIYMEVERADARVRRDLGEELAHILADVRAATGDWQKLRAAMREDADRLPDAEGAALVGPGHPRGLDPDPRPAHCALPGVTPPSANSSGRTARARTASSARATSRASPCRSTAMARHRVRSG